MKRFLLGAAVTLCLALPAQAAQINLGANPSSVTGNFSFTPGGGVINDQVIFTLSGGPAYITIANATNTYAAGTDFITNFSASIYSAGDDQIVNNADDGAPLFGPQAAQPCILTPQCQFVGGGGLINASGIYYAEFTGTGGGTSGYSGNISTFAVPGPMLGAGIPGLLAACGGLIALARRRRRAAA
jgi:hypothetical protein